MLFLFRSAPEVKKRIHSKLFRKFWEEPGYTRANLHYCMCNITILTPNSPKQQRKISNFVVGQREKPRLRIEHLERDGTDNCVTNNQATNANLVMMIMITMMMLMMMMRMTTTTTTTTKTTTTTQSCEMSRI